MTILTSHDIFYPLIGNGLAITLIVSCFIAGLTLLIYGSTKDIDSFAVIGGILLIAVVIAILVFTGIPSKRLDYTEYQVIFDDKYTVNELYKDYEIISVDGDLFTIRPHDGGK